MAVKTGKTTVKKVPKPVVPKVDSKLTGKQKRGYDQVGKLIHK